MVRTLIFVTLFSTAAASEPSAEFLKALHQVEAAGQLSPKDGDKGKAIGPYQIWYSYWKDATDSDKDIGGSYQDCRRKDYAEKVIRAYLFRYTTTRRLHRQATDEDRARIHNGGPNGWKHNSTVNYWLKVKQQLR